MPLPVSQADLNQSFLNHYSPCPSLCLFLSYFNSSFFFVLAAPRQEPVLCQQCWQMQLLSLEEQISSISNHIGNTSYIC